MNHRPLQDWLLSPWVIVPSIAIGILIGVWNQPIALALSPFGNLYLRLLQMCVLPLVITAIITSLGNMLQAGTAYIYLKKLIFIFSCGLLAAAILGLVSAMLFKPGSNLSAQAKTVLSQQIENKETGSNPQTAPNTQQQVVKFIEQIVPGNIFEALTKSENLAVLFFCFLVGIAIGTLPNHLASTALIVFDAVYSAFLKIINWVMYGLPLGLCFLFAGYVAEMGFGIVIALAKLILIIFLASLVLYIIYFFIIWYKTRHSFLYILNGLKTPLLISLSTGSNFAALPTLLTSLQKYFKLNKNITDLVVPLGTSLNHQGTTIQFAAMAVFMSQLYGHPLTLGELTLTIFTSIFASIATSGIPVIAAVSIFAMVLDPINLPTTVGIILLAAIEPLVDPFLTALTTLAIAAAGFLLQHSPSKNPVEKNYSKDTLPAVDH